MLNDYRANERKSLSGLERRLTKHLKPFFKGRRLSSITTADVRAYITKRKADVIATGKGDSEKTRPVSNAEINRKLTALKRMFSLAIESAKLLHRPHIPMLKEDNVRTGFFEAEQFGSVRKHLPDYLQPLVSFMYITGWRRNEVTSLEWRQVDFTAGTVTLDPGTTKNNEGRVFPMTAALRELLKAQQAKHDELKKAGTIEPWVFFRSIGTRGSRTQRRANQKPRAIGSFRKTWIAACRAAGCPGRIPHDFRRTAVRNLVRAGIPERVAMTMTGHKTRSVFEGYNIVSPGDLLDAAKKLDLLHGHNSGHNEQKSTVSASSKFSQVVERIGAGDGDRTRDIKLGKLAFYR
jgi:integrase